MPAKTKVFEIWDNGNKPFIAKIVGKSISVFKRPKDAELISVEELEDQLFDLYPDREKWSAAVNQKVMEQYTELVWTCPRAKKIWIGDDISEGYHGNSILVETNPLHYTEIGMTIFSFTTDDPVTKYFSRMGNNGVPYPVAVTKTAFIFFLEEVSVTKQVLKQFEIPMKTKMQQAFMDSPVSKFNSQEMAERLNKIQGDRKPKRYERMDQARALPLDLTRQIPTTPLLNVRLIHDRV